MSSVTNNRALIIGAGGDLPATTTDANGLAEVLRDPARCAYPTANVTVLTEAQASRDQVLSALDALVNHASADATVIIFFSGHGYIAESSMGESYYLMPHGYNVGQLAKTAISGKEFAAKLAAIPAQRLLLLLDCCHAQGVGESKQVGLTLSKSPIPPEVQEGFRLGSGRILIASSKASELSYASTPYSFFTRALIECLCGADVTTGDGYVRAMDLAMYASRKVTEWSKDKQHPTANTERADNFAVAWYAAGSKTPLPSKLPPLTPAQASADVARQDALVQNVTQSGGINFGQGNEVNVQGDLFGGDKVGGDKVMGDKFTGDKIMGNKSEHQIHTGGGAYIGGNVSAGGDVVGRDKIVTTTTTTQGATLADFNNLLAQLRSQLAAAPLGEDERGLVESDLAVVQTQANNAQPKPGIIKAKLESISAVLKEATGVGLATAGLIQVVQQAVHMVQQVFK